MSRIANYASQQTLNSYIFKVRTRLQDSQIQLSTKMKAEDYMHLGSETQRLITYEVEAGTLDNYQRSNDIQNVYLSSTSTSVESIDTIIKDFRKKLTSYNSLSPTDANSIRGIQEAAFSAMSSMGIYLNDNIGGRYQFSGNRINTTPVDLGLTTLTDFQAKYDGISINYPKTRATHMENFDVKADSTGKANWLTFTQDADGVTTTAGTSTITASTAQFSNITVGGTIDITGTANNNGTYEVSAISGGGTIISIKTVMLTTEAAVTAATITPTGGTALTSADFTSLTFNRGTATISAASGTLSSLAAGTSFTVAGTAQNNGTYIVASNSGTSITVKEVKLTDEGTAATPTLSTGATSLTFTQNTNANDRITGATSQFSAVTAGMKIDIGGTVSNNGSYTVVSVASDGSYVDVLSTLTTEAAGGNETATVTLADGRINSTNYYKGDNFSHTHKVSKNQEFTVNLNAGDPAFERAIRAMGIMAQGKFGTAGGLDQAPNAQRLTDALNLLDLSLEPNSTSNPQYEAGFTNSIKQSLATLTDQAIVINRANVSNKQLSDYLNLQVTKIQTINELDVITRLLNDQNALEASYKAMSTIRGLSLVNYL